MQSIKEAIPVILKRVGLDCRDKVDWPHVGPGLLGRVLYVWVFLRDPSLYSFPRRNN